MSRQIVRSADAPAPIGPYSQAVVAGGLVFASGQIPLDPATGAMAGPDIREQTRRVLDNLAAVLEAAGSSLAEAVKVTVFLRDMNDFPAVNEVYAGYVSADAPPARSTVQVARLPRDAGVEIEAVARVAR